MEEKKILSQGYLNFSVFKSCMMRLMIFGTLNPLQFFSNIILLEFFLITFFGNNRPFNNFKVFLKEGIFKLFMLSYFSIFLISQKF